MQPVHLISGSFYYSERTYSKLCGYYNINMFLMISITKPGLQSKEMRLLRENLAQRVYRDIFD